MTADRKALALEAGVVQNLDQPKKMTSSAATEWIGVPI